MKTGSDLKKLKRSNLVLLYLAVRYAESAKQGASTASQHTLEQAYSFADSVLAAVSAPREQSTVYDPNDPRHDRTVDLFGNYGVSLLEAVITRNEASSFRKLAVLQWLSGNTDDARYWGHRAGKEAAEQPLALDDGVAAQEAFTTGRWYLFNENRAVAETYLDLAAQTGHADAAFLLAEVLEASQRIDEARRWFLTAEANGHSEAGQRLSALKKG
jgi:TPR repeat protein